MVSIWYCFDHAHQQLIRTVITRICSTHIAPPMPCSFVSSAKNFDLDTDSDKGSDSSSHFDPEDGNDAQQTNDISELHDVRLIIRSFNDNLTFTHHILLGPQVHSAQTSESDRTVQDTMDKIWYTEGFKMCTCDSKEGQQTVYGLWRQGHWGRFFFAFDMWLDHHILDTNWHAIRDVDPSHQSWFKDAHSEAMAITAELYIDLPKHLLEALENPHCQSTFKKAISFSIKLCVSVTDYFMY